MREAISFIVIAHHNSQTLAACLDSVQADSLPHDELILVLNNVDPQTKSVSATRSRWLMLNEDRPGPQFARNRGARSAGNKIICFLDADILIPLGWTILMLHNFTDPWVAIGQSKIHRVKEKGFLNWIIRFKYLKFNSMFYFPYGVSCIPTILTLDTAAMMVKKELFDRVGGFDEAFTRMEDSDFSLRVMYHGGDIFFEDRTIAIEANDSEEGFFDFLKKQYFSMKMLPLFLNKHNFDFNFPFTISPKIKKKRTLNYFPLRSFAWVIISQLLELAGIANSPYQLNIRATKYYSFKPNLKKQALLGGSNPNLRTVWVGGKKREYDLFYREFIKSLE